MRSPPHSLTAATLTMRAPFVWPTRRNRRRAAGCAPEPTKPPPEPAKLASTTPSLRLPLSPTQSSRAEGPPSPPPPPPRDGCGERDVRRALTRVEGRPNRVRALIDTLVAAGGSVSTPLAERVSRTLANDATLRRALIDLIAVAERPPPRAPVSVTGPPRERLRLAWAAATFTVAGPAALRAAVSADEGCLRALAGVFGAHNFDAARAALAADVLQAALADSPRVAAAALAAPTGILSSLVARVESAPAADLLARLVGTRVFGAIDAGAVVPAHKSALASLARNRVLHKLGERFEKAAKDEVRVCAHVTKVMAEMNARAVALPRRFEDPDERGDGYSFGIAHLSIVSAHVYNDAVDYLVLPLSPDPMLAVLDIGLQHKDEANVLVPAIELLAASLRALLNARHSALPLVRTAALEKQMSKLELALLERMPLLLPLLTPPQDPTLRVGRVRLALVDALSALLAAASAASTPALLDTSVLDTLLSLLDAFPHASVLHTSIGAALAALLSDPARSHLLRPVLTFFSARADNIALRAHHAHAALPALLAQTDVSDDALRAELALFRKKLAPVVDARSEADKAGLRRYAVQRRAPLAERLAAKGPSALEPSEDRGQLIYVRSGINTANNSSAAHLFVEAAHAAFGALRA